MNLSQDSARWKRGPQFLTNVSTIVSVHSCVRKPLPSNRSRSVSTTSLSLCIAMRPQSFQDKGESATQVATHCSTLDKAFTLSTISMFVPQSGPSCISAVLPSISAGRSPAGTRLNGVNCRRNVAAVSGLHEHGGNSRDSRYSMDSLAASIQRIHNEVLNSRAFTDVDLLPEARTDVHGKPGKHVGKGVCYYSLNAPRLDSHTAQARQQTTPHQSISQWPQHSTAAWQGLATRRQYGRWF